LEEVVKAIIKTKINFKMSSNDNTSVENFSKLKQQAINTEGREVFVREIGKCFLMMSNGEIVNIPIEMEAKLLTFLLHAT